MCKRYHHHYEEKLTHNSDVPDLPIYYAACQRSINKLLILGLLCRLLKVLGFI